MKFHIVLILIFLAIFCHAQTLQYEIQVGAYRDIANANSAISRLRDAGFNPYQDTSMGLSRVRISGIREGTLTATLAALAELGFTDPWVLGSMAYAPPADAPLYRVQTGAYRERQNAESDFSRIVNAGLNPSYENYEGLTRVFISGLSESEVPSIVQRLNDAGFSDLWIREESALLSDAPSTFTIFVNAGAVTEITPTGSTAPLRIIQTIPSFREVDADDNTYQADAPVIFFFSEVIYLGSLEDNIIITADGIPVDGTIVINEGVGGYAILTFTPAQALPDGAEVAITMRQGLMDGGGNPMTTDVNLSYVTEEGSQTIFRGSNFGFESGNEGIIISGDGAISGARGPLLPFEGSYYAAISTGENLVSASGIAIGNRSSQLQLGPVMEEFTSLSFYYDFISSEFNDYVGSRYDDTAMLTIYGPMGVYTEVITSVNTIRRDNNPFIGYTGMPDAGDNYAGHTGWLFFRVDNINVGSPAFIIFTVSDVGDDHLSSILAIDALVLE